MSVAAKTNDDIDVPVPTRVPAPMYECSANKPIITIKRERSVL